MRDEREPIASGGYKGVPRWHDANDAGPSAYLLAPEEACSGKGFAQTPSQHKAPTFTAPATVAPGRPAG